MLERSKRNTNKLKQIKKAEAATDGGWYFVMFARDFAGDRSYKFAIYNETFVLFRDEHKKLACYLFPVYEKTKFSNNACIQSFLAVEKQGIIWFWRGNSELADEDLITVKNILGQPVECYDQE